MKRIVLFSISFIAALISVNCFAQNQSPQVRALQGTWTLIAIMGNEISYSEENLKAESIDVTYTFSENNVTILSSGDVIGPVQFEPIDGCLKLTGESTGYLPYSLHGNILILHERNHTYIYRKK